MENFYDSATMQMGLSIALRNNREAMARFATLTEEEQRDILSRSRGVRSKAEMEAFVQTVLLR